MRIFFVPILLCFLFNTAFSQQLYFNHLSVNNGLTQGVNNYVYKDSRGFVWISSFDGLNRFDGLDCRKYYSSPEEKQGLKGTLFLNILEDKNSNLWIGSNAGLNLYKRNADSFSCYRIDALTSGDQFCSPFYIDQQNKIWVQSGSKIFVFDPLTHQFSSVRSNAGASSLIIKTVPLQLYQPLKKLLVFSNTADVFWQGNIGSGAVEWKQQILPAGTALFKTVATQDENNYWVGTDKGLLQLQLNKDSIQLTKIKETGVINISSLHLDKAGALWMGSFADGLFKMDVITKNIQQYSSKENSAYAISGSRIVNVYTDDNRNLWVSVWGKGVDYANLDKFHFNQYLTKAEAVAAGTDNFTRSVVAVNNELWCATQSGGIVILDEAKQVKQVIKNIPASAEHMCVIGDEVWIATFNGIFAAGITAKKVRKIDFNNTAILNPKSFQFNYIYPLKNGKILLSSNAGLFIAEKKENKYSLKEVKGTGSSDVYLTSFMDADGKLYLSKAFRGLTVYTLQNDSVVMVKQYPLQASIKCFAETGKSTLWIGSTIGLIRFDKPTNNISKIFTTSDGLNNQYIYGVIEDGGYLWLSTNAGISRFNPADGTVKVFSAADGLQSNEYNTYAFCKANNGELFFGGVNGLNGFHPARLKPFNTPPVLTLNQLQVNDTLYRSPVNYAEIKKLDVDYNQNTIGFQFSVIDYADASATRISYMLQGYDKTWVNAANKALIRYVKLPPGNYVLKVKAFNADGISTKELYQLPIAVATPWWQSWWFRMLMVGIFAAFVTAAIRQYLHRRLREQKTLLEKELAVEQERIRLARELHDGLGSMLSGIKHSFSAIKNEIELPGEKEQQFNYTIEKLDDSIKDLRAVSHTMFSAEFLQDGLDAAIKNYCSAVSGGGRVQIVFENLVKDATPIKGELAFHIFRIVQELVQNIIRHAASKQAIVQLAYHDELLSLTVEDDGAGFDLHTVKPNKGIGLKNIESRIKTLHGKLDIQSAPGKGTSVFIEVPLK